MPRNNWMRDISSDTSLRDISLPGTHDSATHVLGNALWVGANAAAFLAVLTASTVLAPIAALGFGRVRKIFQTQSLSIRAQLDYGIRFLDLRINAVGNGFKMFHGPMPLFTELSDILAEVAGFLADNPSETVLICLKKENSDNADAVLARLIDYVSPFDPIIFAHGRIPDLGEVRGRMVFINRIALGSAVPEAEDKCGIYLDFADNRTFASEMQQNGARSLDVLVQDLYQPSGDAIDEKKQAIKSAYAVYSEGAFDLRINFTSANIPPAAPQDASDFAALLGTTPGAFADEINPELRDFMRRNMTGAGWITVIDYAGRYGSGNDEPVASAISMNSRWTTGAGGNGTLRPGSEIPLGKALYSPNGSWRAEFQSDGNFAVYRNVDNFSMRSAGTNGKGATRAAFETDGNFVISDGRRLLSATGTQNQGADALVMQNDGSLTIYAGQRAIWSSDSQTFR